MSADRSKTGVVFNIQKFSVNDGPGIRTVVFVKGCPLHCAWCANPESQSTKVQVLWDRKECLHCHHCLQTCPKNAVFLQGESIRIHHDLCDGCGICVKECPGHALSLEGERKSVGEVMKTVMQDLPFYEESNGGITLSGGEMLAQPAFAIELLKAANEDGINTCCETTGACDQKTFVDVITHVDYVLMDLKHYDARKHKQYTGVSNENILANMKAAIAMGKDVLPRIPVIPGFNASLDDARGLCEALKQVGAQRCQLLPFHQFGENKYAMLGKAYAYENVKALHAEDLQDYQKVFLDHEINAFF
ncbi:MAG: glycyl-radical enzyme activating protein [Lactimicrobium sp.]|jgi:pyruvate formate lyase activating enzyme|uniref:glycyl-radical enzyme activating protein n=1 Tax=Lactimicrobium sp. TaxID=2563780 RepID=UPI002F3543C7